MRIYNSSPGNDDSSPENPGGDFTDKIIIRKDGGFCDKGQA